MHSFFIRIYIIYTYKQPIVLHFLQNIKFLFFFKLQFYNALFRIDNVTFVNLLKYRVMKFE